MVRDDHGLVLGSPGTIQPLVGPAHEPIQLHVPLVHDIWTVAAEHVLDPVQGVKYYGEDPLIESTKLLEKDPLSCIKYGSTQIQELGVRNPSFLQGCGILGPAKRQEWTKASPHSLHKGLWRGVAPGRVQGMELEWQRIQSDLGPHLGQDHAGYGTNLDQEAHLEGDLEYGAPVPNSEFG